MTSKINMHKRHDIIKRSAVLPISKAQVTTNKEPVGVQLARLRQAAGFSQRDLAKKTGISQRMIAYYEKQQQYPPLHVLTTLAQALGVPPGEMLNFKEKKTDDKVKDMRIRRRLKQMESLDEKDKLQILQLLDTLIENNRLKQKFVPA